MGVKDVFIAGFDTLIFHVFFKAQHSLFQKYNRWNSKTYLITLAQVIKMFHFLTSFFRMYL